MLLLPYIIIFVFLILLLKNKTWSFCFYLACRLVLPPVIRLGAMSMNTVMAFLMLFVLILSFSKLEKWRKRLFFPLTLLILPLGVLSFFGIIPYNVVFKNLFQFFVTEISPCLFLACCLKGSKDIKLVLSTILVSYLAIGVWGIMTYVLKMNPYYTYFVLNFGGDFEYADYTGDGFGEIRGSLDAAASGNVSGPLPWGQESMLIALFFLFYDKIKMNKKLLIVIVVLAFLNVFLTGKRSCLLPLIIFGAYFCGKRGLLSLKNVLLSFVILLASYVVISSVPMFKSLNKNIESTVFFWDDKVATKNNIEGSSMEMRQAQFEYANYMISTNPFCGLGFDYPSYYSSKYGKHPVMLGFESIYFFVLVSSGILGLIIWFLFFRRIYLLTNVIPGDFKFSLAYHGGFLLSCIMTAIQSSLWIYLILSFLYIINSNLEVKNK